MSWAAHVLPRRCATATALGAPVTLPPYSIVWNTTTTTNGAHTLTAQAVDLSGNPGTSAGVSVTVSNASPVPVLTSHAPASVTAGAAGFTLTVTGSGFVPGSTVRWDGAARTTTFSSATQLTAAIPAADRWPISDTLAYHDWHFGGNGDVASFMSALGAFDMFAIEKYNKPWNALSPVEQDTLLQTASTTAPGNRPSFPGAPPATTGKTTIGDHFNNLKGWIAGAYFSSEKGARELGWDGNVFHTELPGCAHPDGHA